MKAALEYDAQVELDYTLEQIRAGDLQERDTIVADACVPLLVAEVNGAVYSFVSIRYSCLAGSGWRTYATETPLEVLRPKPEAAL